MDEVKKMYDQISELYGKGLPRQVVVDLLSKIPTEIGPDEDAYGKYVYLTAVYTVGEYMSTLSLFDKRYHSLLHEYGELEELLYSYQYISPGLIKDHKIRNEKGRFIHTALNTDAKKVNPNVPNVYLIKRTSWDSIKSDKKMVTYTIYVYNQKSEKETERRRQVENTLGGMKKSMRSSMKRSISNGN